MKQYKTACGGTINISNQAASHLAAHSNVLDHLERAINSLQLPASPEKFEREIDMGRPIGRSGIVRTTPLDLDGRATFALRKNRKFPSRVAAVGELGDETSGIVVIARPSLVASRYELITAWVGALARKEPWDATISNQDDFNECLSFWSSTALVYEAETMGLVFESSWREVLSQSRCRFELGERSNPANMSID